MNRFQILKNEEPDFPLALVEPTENLNFSIDSNLIQSAEGNRSLVIKSFELVREFIKISNTRFNAKVGYFRQIQDRDGYKQDFCTLHINLSRISGNTALAALICNCYKNSILIVPTVGLFKEDGRSAPLIEEKRLYSFRSRNLIGLTRDIVVVDTASYIPKTGIDRIYSINSHNFIFIQ
jgi:hypothetical protein